MKQFLRDVALMAWWQISRIVPWCCACALIAIWNEKAAAIILLLGLPAFVWRYRRWCKMQGIRV